jgi:hypothetical protein
MFFYFAFLDLGDCYMLGAVQISVVFFLEKFINLDTLLQELKVKYMYQHSRTSLAKLLKNIGFTYKKDDNRRALMEKPYVGDPTQKVQKKIYGQFCFHKPQKSCPG